MPPILPTALSLVLGAALVACAGEPRIERREARTPSRIAEVLPVSVEEAHRRLRAGLQEKLAGSDRYSGLEVATNDAPIFPDPVQQRLNAEGNPGLARYAALPAEAKALDFYLHDPLDRYWPSEDEIDGVPVQFRCDFFLHLEPAEGGGTRVEVIEYLPKVWVGNRFELLGRHGPGRYRDVRKVEPTARDREALLALVRSVLSSSRPRST